MPQQLILTLFVEGEKDTVFLEAVVQRTAQELVSERSDAEWDVPELSPAIVRDKFRKRISDEDQKILEAAKEYSNSHALILHFDAGERNNKTALTRHFIPAQNLVSENKTIYPLCEHLVPIIPIQETEAWMLADLAALEDVLGVDDLVALGVPRLPKEVEKLADPKKVLDRVLAKVNQKRSSGRHINKDVLISSLAIKLKSPEHKLDTLRKVPAYRQFENDLAAALIKANVIRG